MPDNPFDQFDAPKAAPATSSASNPFDQFDAPKAGPATAQTPAKGPGFSISDPATWALAGLDSAGMGLGTKNPFMAMPDQLKQDVAGAHSAFGLADYPLSAAAYAVGPGKILGPAGKLLGGAGIGGVAAEGALAGGASSAIADPTNLSGIATGAATGGALGTAAGGLGKVAEGLLTKPGSIDPAAAIAATKQLKTDAYAKLSQVPVDPAHVDGVIDKVMSNLDPSVQTGMSPGLRNQISNIRSTLQDQDSANAGQVDSWQRQINAAAQREGHPTDSIVAGQINSGLDGVIKANGAGVLQGKAAAAHQNYANAQDLADWQAKTAAGAPIGQAPLTVADKYYQGQSDKAQTLINLYQKNQSGMDPSYSLSHTGGHIGSAIGGMIGGWPVSLLGGQIGQLGTKYLAKKGLTGVSKNSMQRAYQDAYPQLTGQQLTGGQAAPQVGGIGAGDLIKNLMLGVAY